MYAINPNKNWVVKSNPVSKKHFFASSESSNNSLLHFSYRLVDLQKEIEKRTFYLGKNRSAEGAQHLLDLIGMSRDEGDLLYPFAKAAMADVYDQLNKSTLHIQKKYEWKDPVSPIKINKIPNIEGVSISKGKSTLVDDGQGIRLLLELRDYGLADDGGDIDVTKYRLSATFELELTIQYDVIGANSHIEYTKKVIADVPCDYFRSIDSTRKEWLVGPYNVPIQLESQSNITTKESIKEIISVNVIDSKLQLINPKILQSGDIIELDNLYYEVIKDTQENDLDLSTQAILVDENEALVEGIHYYFSVPNYLNITAIEPLDTAILEALVNRIIWKWLVISYPSEAATYDTLYQDNLNAISHRCNIFNKHWQQVPRIL